LNELSKELSIAVYCICGGAACLVFAMLVMVYRSLIRPIKYITKSLDSERSSVPYIQHDDEIGNLARKIASVLNNREISSPIIIQKNIEDEEYDENLQDSIKSVSRIINSTKFYSGSILRHVNETKDKYSNILNINSSICNTIKTCATDVTRVFNEMNIVNENLNKSLNLVESTFTQLENADHTSQKLNDAAHTISNVMIVIDNLAEQINLLALNATIESVRAGEAGKGFSVVASEVKALAGQTTHATEEISGQVQSIKEVSNRVIEILKGIKDSISSLSGVSSTISTSIKEQINTINALSKQIKSSEENSNSVINSEGSIKTSFDTTLEQVNELNDLLAKLNNASSKMLFSPENSNSDDAQEENVA